MHTAFTKGATNKFTSSLMTSTESIVLVSFSSNGGQRLRQGRVYHNTINDLKIDKSRHGQPAICRHQGPNPQESRCTD